MKQKTLERVLAIICYILGILSFAWFGAELGRMFKMLTPDGNAALRLLLFCGSFAVFIVWYLVHIVLHEGGHMVAGLITGYKLVSFRIGTRTFVKENGKIAVKKMTIPGTGGQCLMCPPECEPEKCPFSLYLAGGGSANLLAALLCFILYFIFPRSIVTYLVLFIGGITGLCLGLTNLFPAKIGGVANDGYNLFIDFVRNPSSKAAQYYVLTLNAVLSEADGFEELPQELLDAVMNYDYSDLVNASVANLYNFKAAIHFARHEYDKALECQRRILETEHVLGIFKNEAKCECLYFEIIGGCNAGVIDQMYDKELQAYIKATACYPSRKRLMYAYYKIYRKDEQKAQKEYEELLKLIDSYPVKADVQTERKAVEELMNIAKESEADEVAE